MYTPFSGIKLIRMSWIEVRTLAMLGPSDALTAFGWKNLWDKDGQGMDKALVPTSFQ